MLKIKANIDKNAETSCIGIRAHGTTPEIAGDIEIVVSHIISGLVQQVPTNERERVYNIFKIAAFEGARTALERVK